MHFDNEVSYFKDNIYKDKTYQFLPVPIKANCKNVQKTAGASLSTDVLTGLENIFSQTNRKQDYAKRQDNIGNMIILHQEQERLLEQQIMLEKEELLCINLAIEDIIKKLNLNLKYQTDYEFARELLINECRETIAIFQKSIYLNTQAYNKADNAYREIRIIKNTSNEYQG